MPQHEHHGFESGLCRFSWVDEKTGKQRYCARFKWEHFLVSPKMSLGRVE